MKVQIHKLFEYLLETTSADVEAVRGFSLSTPPLRGAVLADLDPEQSLDWSNQSFQGLDALRRHVLVRAGLEQVCALDDVLITAGAAEANFLAISQLLQPGDELIVEAPGWPQAAVLGRAVGATIKEWPRCEQQGWSLDPDQLAGLITDKTRLVFLSNPNNPTGHLLDEARLRKICEIAERAGAYVLVDEVYAGLEWDGVRTPSVAGLSSCGITTGSVSKALGLQGLRTGWLICRDPQLIRDALILRENSSEIMNVMGELIAEIALRPERYAVALAKARAEGQANLALLDQYVQQRTDLSWHRPAAGLIGLCRMASALESDRLARRLLAPPYRTFLIPGSAYGCPHHIRLGVGGGEMVNLQRVLERLAACLDSLAA